MSENNELNKSITGENENTPILPQEEENRAEIEIPLTTKSEIETAPQKKTRISKTANFTPAEYAEIEKIVQLRAASRITRDWNHFLRQCVDFAINCKHIPGSQFATSDGPSLPVILKDAFFTSLPNKKK